MIRTIMIVDDDPGALKLYGKMLKLVNADFEVLTAEDAVSALALHEQSPPDLFILDVMMPGISGIELCRHLRARPATAGTPILMLSALGRPETIEEALDAGANDYILKPSSVQQLEERINSLLGVTSGV
jgi:DNA-binding response OmpR family regulator